MEDLHPNSLDAIRSRLSEGRVSTAFSLFSLPMRALLCVAAQALTVLLLGLGGTETGTWSLSTGYWPLFGTVANFATIGILSLVLRREGLELRQLWSPAGEGRREDIGTAVTASVVAVIFSVAVHVGLSALLFDSAAHPFAHLKIAGPTPLRWAMGLLYVASGAFAVYPLFAGFAVPRLAAISGMAGAAYLLGALWLGAQQLVLPFVVNWQYIVWKLVIFLPLALLFFSTVARRPGTLRYLMIAFVFVHVVLLIAIEVVGEAALPNS